MQMTDYDALARRTFDEPYDTELRDAILVCADALEQTNDPRGALIAMEHALASAEPRRAIELRRAMQDHVIEHGATLLGGMSSLLSFKRAIAFEWRAGRMYGVAIDTRHLPAKAGVSCDELVNVVIRAPAAIGLRRLRVRVRGNVECMRVIQMLGQRQVALPLEEIEIGARVWPNGLMGVLPRTGHGTLVAKYPNLFHLALYDLILPLPVIGDTPRKPGSDLEEVRLVGAPTSASERRILGRALCSGQADIRSAAFHRVRELGPRARVFERVLTVLLQPRVVLEGHLEIVTALQALGPSRDLMLALAKVSSRAGQYDLQTRSAAGSAAAAFRAAFGQ
jgi:hypothetical protein